MLRAGGGAGSLSPKSCPLLPRGTGRGLQHHFKWHFTPFSIKSTRPLCGTLAPFAVLCLHSRVRSWGQGALLGASRVLGRGEKGSWMADAQHPARSVLPGCSGAPWAAFPELPQGLPPAEGVREGGSPGSPLRARPPPCSGAQKLPGAVLAFFTCPDWV